ncbi:MAG: N4-(beta-N-acetylglucosaminyl)-L-asparaginase [Cognaticolwellia sp.]|jgi:isoaspartyl peptidase/L-asparaginase-like protein (Ntn-hydrolase superfamily)|tara:strand:+ start:853 stop:1842 length:990 start_codon:yes stop_codon:yes gene_type:complete
MALSRRNFLNTSILGGMTLFLGCKEESSTNINTEKKKSFPMTISTWNHGLIANEEAMGILTSGGRALDAVEAGVKTAEADAEGHSVGIGGLPDRDGYVTLDACIMDEKGNAGSVCFLEDIIHPISVARKVMEETPHVMLVGDGALQFALSQGFKREKLLTEKSEKSWKKWLEKSKYEPIINIENHDTISQIAIDSEGNISGACTTSGLAYKLHGRVGDSPIIGAGLFVDNEVGGACATGLGEAVLKTLGSFLIVELMRNGMTPQEACEEAINRIVRKQDYANFQIGYLAVDKNGNYGAYAIHPGFNFAVAYDGKNELIDAPSYVKKKVD